MKKKASWLLAVSLLGGSVISGCTHHAVPLRDTNETRAAKGLQTYGAHPDIRKDNHQLMQDTNNMQTALTTRSAHALAYELEYQPFIKGCAVLVVGRDAYIGVTPPQGGTVTPDNVRFIKEKAQFLDKTLRRVYVTTNPSAVKYLSGYTDALERGLPLDKYEGQFYSFVAKTWPPNRSTP